MEIRYIKQDELKQALALNEYCFKDITPLELEVMEKDTYKPEQILGAFEGEKLASSIWLRPLEVFCNQKVEKMYALASVTSDPAFRLLGQVKELMIQSVKEIYKTGATVSYLCPFSYEFYGRFDYAWTFSHQITEVEVEAFKKFKKQDATYTMIDIENGDQVEQLKTVYNKYCEKYNGSLNRDSWAWKSRLGHFATDKTFVVAVENSKKEITAYMCYKILDKVMHIDEIISNDLDSTKSLYKYIFAHNVEASKAIIKSPVDDNILHILDSPRHSVKIEPHMSVRVINVEKKLALISTLNENESFVIEIEDKIIEENSGKWKVENCNGTITVSKSSADADLSCDIKIFSQLAMHFVSFEQALLTDKVKSFNKSKAALLNSVFCKKTTFLNDQF